MGCFNQAFKLCKKGTDTVPFVCKIVPNAPRRYSWFRVDLDQKFEAGRKSTGRMTYPGHEGAPWVVHVERMEPERLFTFRWYDSDDGSIEQNDDQPALLVEFQLEEIVGGTRLTITESGFSALPRSRRIEVMRRNEEGWKIQAENLAQHFSA